MEACTRCHRYSLPNNDPCTWVKLQLSQNTYIVEILSPGPARQKHCHDVEDATWMVCSLHLPEVDFDDVPLLSLCGKSLLLGGFSAYRL